KGERWQGLMISQTSQAYRSGGTCTTDWRTSLRLTLADGGSISGSGSARLTSGPNCPFVTGQPQLHGFDVKVTGSSHRSHLELHLTADPHGNGIDYGGFGEVFGGGRSLGAPIVGGVPSIH